MAPNVIRREPFQVLFQPCQRLFGIVSKRAVILVDAVTASSDDFHEWFCYYVHHIDLNIDVHHRTLLEEV